MRCTRHSASSPLSPTQTFTLTIGTTEMGWLDAWEWRAREVHDAVKALAVVCNPVADMIDAAQAAWDKRPAA